MSSSQDQFPKPSRTVSSSPTPPDAQASQISEPVPSEETAMDQHLDSPIEMAPSASPTESSDVSSPSAPESTKASPAPESSSAPAAAEAAMAAEESAAASQFRHQPIPPASEPRQYRAIGLVRGKYVPSEEQLTRGNLLTDDGAVVDAVLLGRIMSLVKKHIDLEHPHLWVVYPRTRDKSDQLHVQIVGVWEPENLAQDDSEASPEAAEAALEATGPDTATDTASAGTAEPGNDAVAASADSSMPQDGYFSVRGEVIFQSPEDEQLVIKIQQAPRRGSDQGKAFKLNLKGHLGGRAVGYFWDLNVERQAGLLVVKDGTMIGLVPPKKRTAKSIGRYSGDKPMRKKPWSGGDRQGGPPRPGNRSEAPAPSASRRGPVAKPVVKRRSDSSEVSPE